MSKVKNGDTIKVHYTGRLETGSIFDTSDGRDPLKFTVGAGQVIQGFDKAVLDMEVGEKKTVHIPVAEAYGPVSESNFIEFPKNELPAGMTPEVGLELHVSDDQGRNFPVVISEIKEESIILNANHPLAGKDLVFEIDLVEII